MRSIVKALTDKVVLRENPWEVEVEEVREVPEISSDIVPGLKVKMPGFEIHDINTRQKVYLPVEAVEKIVDIYMGKMTAFREVKKKCRAELKLKKEENVN